eukprot:6552305-Ditylum_brightwellii.AAC.1
MLVCHCRDKESEISHTAMFKFQNQNCVCHASPWRCSVLRIRIWIIILTVNNIDKEEEDSDESAPPVLDQEPIKMFATNSTIWENLFQQLENLQVGETSSVPGQETFEAGDGVVMAHGVV